MKERVMPRARTKPVVYGDATIYPPTPAKPTVWRVVYYDRGGNPRERTTTSLDAAKALADSLDTLARPTRGRGRAELVHVGANRTVAEVAERLLVRLEGKSINYRQTVEGVLRL